MKTLSVAFALVALAFIATACSSSVDTGKPIKSAAVGNLTATLSNTEGVLKHGDAEFFLTFKDASGNPVEVGAVALNFQMPAMGTMPALNNAAVCTSTGRPGVYHGRVTLVAAGDWQAQISYEGPVGKGKTSFTVTAQ